MHPIKVCIVFAGQEFQALFMSTTEPVDADGNTKNPTKSPCDPYIFNTVITRSKSLVVVVGNPLALLRIEEHMEKRYGEKAHCWSSYIRLCLENSTFIIPSEVEPNKDKKSEFSLWLKAILLGPETSRIASRLADPFLHHVPQVQQIPYPSNTASRQQGSATISEAPQGIEQCVSAAPMRHSSSIPDAPANQKHLQSISERQQDATSKQQHVFPFCNPLSKEINNSTTPRRSDTPSNRQCLESRKHGPASKQQGSATLSQAALKQKNSTHVKAALPKVQDHRGVVPPLPLTHCKLNQDLACKLPMHIAA